MPDNGSSNSNKTRTKVLLGVFVGLVIIDFLLWNRLGPDYWARVIGHVVGALLFPAIVYGSIYGIFLRKKQDFSYDAILISAIVLISIVIINVIILY